MTLDGLQRADMPLSLWLWLLTFNSTWEREYVTHWQNPASESNASSTLLARSHTHTHTQDERSVGKQRDSNKQYASLCA